MRTLTRLRHWWMARHGCDQLVRWDSHIAELRELPAPLSVRLALSKRRQHIAECRRCGAEPADVLAA